MKEIRLLAPAKINLCLDIKGSRPDGYHQLEMVMQSIALYDTIYIKKTNSGIKVDSSRSKLPKDRGNLAYKAAELILQELRINAGVDIYIEKNIPLAAGLAGGSSDAAAVLKGINRLYNLNIDMNRLKKMASRIGADVPFCLKGGTAFAYDKGDKIEQLPDLRKIDLILITPPREVSTAMVYQAYDQFDFKSEIPVVNLVKMIKKKQIINWNEGWANALEPVTSYLVDDVKDIKESLIKMGVNFCLMSGSGPTVFGVVDNLEQARFIKLNWQRKDDFIFLVRTIKQDFKE